MKTVYSSNSELIHVWANNDDASVFKRANSVSCQHDRLKSFNTCIAEIVNNTVILNSHSYSNSTSKHQSLARQAIHGLTALSIDIPLWNNSSLVYGQHDFDESIVKYNEATAADYLVKASRARKNAGLYLAMAHNVFQTLIDYAALLNLTYNAGNIDELQAAAIAQNEIAKEREKARMIERKQEQAEKLELWRNGENVNIHFEVTALRIHDDEIQTSKGARIPIEHAIKAWPLLKRLHNANEPYIAGAHSIKLGHYSVNKIDKSALYIGCHTIPFNEIENIASKLNLAA